MAGLYIHIPFCESRCIYCGFFSTTSLPLRDDYVSALCREMELRPLAGALGSDEPVTTVYLGGGTPSQLSRPQLLRLFRGIGTYVGANGGFDGMEVTMECNPDDVTEEFCETLRLLPVNRISMGAQTFSDDRLRFLRRRHSAEEVRLAVSRLRGIGIGNISVDLIFGFPGERLADWQGDIDEAIGLGVEHLSAYSLMYEEGTLLHRLQEQGKVEEIDEELSLRMYDTLIDRLASTGYEHYEISNFARPGYRSRHNSSYWQETPYVGIGAAAHSYRRHATADGIEASRSWNVADIRSYIDSINRGILPSEQEVLDADTRYNDLITTALRTADGIDLERMRREFGERAHRLLMREAERHIHRGVMKSENRRLSLTRAGLYVSDDIMSDFMIVT